MATTPTAPAYEPGTEYDVVLDKVVNAGGVKFLPRDQHIMSGAFLNRIVTENADVIGSAVAR